MPDAPPTEGPAARGIRRIGIALLLLASLLPYHGCIAHPGEFEEPPSSDDNYLRSNEPYRPITVVEFHVRQTGLQQGPLSNYELFFFPGDWTSNDDGWVLFLGLIPWILFLGLARRHGSRTRRITAISVFVLTVLLPPTLALVSRYAAGFDWLHAIGIGAAAALILAARPAGRRHPADIEATLATHAMLGLGIAFFRPAVDVSKWIFEEGHTVNAVLLAMLHNYRPGFYLTVAALCLIAAPLYFSEDALARLYDRLPKWRSRSSTPTPTSTSTGSTPTAAPSSTAPAPPASSPS
jgi:hypothetical protein